VAPAIPSPKGFGSRGVRVSMLRRVNRIIRPDEVWFQNARRISGADIANDFQELVQPTQPRSQAWCPHSMVVAFQVL